MPEPDLTTQKPKRPDLTTEEKIAKAEARIKKLRKASKENTRKIEDRKKIIAGAALLRAFEAWPYTQVCNPLILLIIEFFAGSMKSMTYGDVCKTMISIIFIETDLNLSITSSLNLSRWIRSIKDRRSRQTKPIARTKILQVPLTHAITHKSALIHEASAYVPRPRQSL